MPVTVVVDGYRALPESLTAIRLVANPANGLRSRTPARLYLHDTFLERLPQDLEDMAAALGPFIQEAHAVVGPRHLARPRHVAPADQPHIGEGVMGGAKRPGRDQGRTIAHEASQAVDARGLNGFGQGHLWQESREPVHRPHGEDLLLSGKRHIGLGGPAPWAQRRSHTTKHRAGEEA
jgi:hypothetical protein